MLLVALGIVVGCSTGRARKTSNSATVGAMHVLRDNCLACHGEEKHKGGLTLSSRKGLLAGAATGPVVSAKSLEGGGAKTTTSRGGKICGNVG